MLNVLSVDVEDYFHPTEVSRFVAPHQWDCMPSRVVGSTSRILDIFAEAGARGTFFVLGWVAQRHPRLLERILREGHEIGCHSYSHRLIYEISPTEFREDTRLAKLAIEDACGVSPRGYRAPSFSLTRQVWWALDILAELGFTHDSSIYPISHDRYGIPNYTRVAHQIETASGPICEVPISTAAFAGGRRVPVGGGAYFRLFPYRYTSAGFRRLNVIEGEKVCFYIHPWELDPGQPRLARGFLSRVRTYGGLSATESKLRRLLADFNFSTLTENHPLVIRKSSAAEAVV